VNLDVVCAKVVRLKAYGTLNYLGNDDRLFRWFLPPSEREEVLNDLRCPLRLFVDRAQVVLAGFVEVLRQEKLGEAEDGG
jgi:hypothetical protein